MQMDKRSFEMTTIDIPKGFFKPVGVVYNNDDGTAVLVMANSIEEAMAINVPLEFGGNDLTPR